ncbi:hypothetical protein IMG5_012580, partial [Ichthyophthirius multifiliis]
EQYIPKNYNLNHNKVSKKEYKQPEDQQYYLNEDRIYYQHKNAFQNQKQNSQNFPKVLMVTEKPSIAKTLAEALSDGSSRQRQGYSKYLPVHEFQGNIFNQNAFIRITSVAGHVYSLDFTRDYSNWDRTDPIELFKAKTQKIESNPQQKVIKHLEQESKDCSYLVLWLDNDREGENICFEVKRICEPQMIKENTNKLQTLRAKFSSLTKKDLKEAYQKIIDPPNLNDCLAVDARQIIDLKVGVAFSRFQTTYFRKKYPDLNEKMITYGPCQTPTLGFCVRREDEIKSFKPKLFYRLLIQFRKKDEQIDTQAVFENGNIFNQQEANSLLTKIIKQKEGQVFDVFSEKGIKGRPEGLNTVQLLKMGSSYLHLSPQQTMHVAEKLYLQGFITYPRTESTSYAKNFPFEDICRSLCQLKNSQVSQDAQLLFRNGIYKPKQGVDIGDHPPITPTNYVPSNNQLRNEESNLYEYVCKHFMASISADCSFMKSQISINVNGLNFKCTGVQIINKGFIEIMDWISISENNLPIGILKGNKVEITTTRLEQEYQTPPGYLTETELINLMEKNKIGTDASLATHINTICEREYVKISGNNRQLIPSDMGRCLIKGYQLIDESLVLPEIRSQIENQVDQIAKGYSLFSSYYKNVEDQLVQAKPFSKCGQCKRFMKIIEKAGKFFCEQCQINLIVPTGGKYKIVGEKYCPYDGYQVVFFTSANPPNVSFDLCPKCYTQSPLIDSDQVTCSICTNEQCQYSTNNRKELYENVCFFCDEELSKELKITQYTEKKNRRNRKHTKK